MRKCLIIMAIVLLLLTFSACYPPETPAQEGMFAPYCIVEENVPFADNAFATRWDKADKLEEDAYGREYYTYETYSNMLGGYIEVHVICQASDTSGSCAYYQDDCYIIRMKDDVLFNEDDIAWLKARNDWNMPIVQEKMTYTTYDSCNDNIAIKQTMEDAVRKYLNLEESDILLSNYMRKLSETEQLCFICTYPRDGVREHHRYWFAIYQSDTIPHIQKCVEIPYTLTCQEAARVFRESWYNAHE